jgi:hypothetical protein
MKICPILMENRRISLIPYFCKEINDRIDFLVKNNNITFSWIIISHELLFLHKFYPRNFK